MLFLSPGWYKTSIFHPCTNVNPSVTPQYHDTNRVLEIWKTDLKTINEKAAEALADPVKYPNLFPDLNWALKVCYLSVFFCVCIKCHLSIPLQQLSFTHEQLLVSFI